MMKRCPKCGIEKQLHHFYCRRDRGGQPSSWCKACIKARTEAHKREMPRPLLRAFWNRWTRAYRARQAGLTCTDD